MPPAFRSIVPGKSLKHVGARNRGLEMAKGFREETAVWRAGAWLTGQCDFPDEKRKNFMMSRKVVGLVYNPIIRVSLLLLFGQVDLYLCPFYEVVI